MSLLLRQRGLCSPLPPAPRSRQSPVLLFGTPRHSVFLPPSLSAFSIPSKSIEKHELFLWFDNSEALFLHPTLAPCCRSSTLGLILPIAASSPSSQFQARWPHPLTLQVMPWNPAPEFFDSTGTTIHRPHHIFSVPHSPYILISFIPSIVSMGHHWNCILTYTSHLIFLVKSQYCSTRQLNSAPDLWLHQSSCMWLD